MITKEATAWRAMRDMYEMEQKELWGFSGPYICNVLDLNEPITTLFDKDILGRMCDRIREHIEVEETANGDFGPILENWVVGIPLNDGLQVRAMFCELMALECLEEIRETKNDGLIS